MVCRFQFRLKLPDGAEIDAQVLAEHWQWHVAFTRACVAAEQHYGLGPYAGIVCLDYEAQAAEGVLIS